VFSLNLHVHSRFFHGWGPRATPYDPLGAALVAAIARRRDLDGLAFTNHDYAWTPDRAPLTTIPGIEISTTRGHVLVVGPDPPSATKLGAVTPERAVELAHEGGCAAIMAHPFRNGDLPDCAAAFDAVEINGKQPGNRQEVTALAEERGVPLVGGSDAHYPIEVGRAYTRVDADDRSPEGVVAAIRDGRVEPVQANRGLDRVLGPVYQAIHRQKGHLRDAEGDGDRTAASQAGSGS
jgi:predicted metal-dependent phosphoesterase TrpH